MTWWGHIIERWCLCQGDGARLHNEPNIPLHLPERVEGATLSNRCVVCSEKYKQSKSTRHLRLAEQGLLHVPFARTSTMQSRAFSVVGPLVWNGLPLALRSLPGVFSQKFLQQLKTTLFGRAGVGSASE